MTLDQVKGLFAAEEGSAIHQAFRKAQNEYEDQINQSATGYVRGDCVNPPVKRLCVEESSTIRGSRFMGIFWPSSIYTKIKRSAPPKAKLTVYRGEVGVVLEDDHCPVGCTRLERLDDSAVTPL